MFSYWLPEIQKHTPEPPIWLVSTKTDIRQTSGEIAMVQLQPGPLSHLSRAVQDIIAGYLGQSGPCIPEADLDARVQRAKSTSPPGAGSFAMQLTRPAHASRRGESRSGQRTGISTYRHEPWGDEM